MSVLRAVFLTMCSVSIGASQLETVNVNHETQRREHPAPATSYVYKITPKQNGYCQVRLDFNTLQLEDPIDGNCVTGKVEFMGQKDSPVNVPVICGYNDGQLMYLNFDGSNTIFMTITTESSSSAWSIDISQILCSDPVNLAPEGCLQYYYQFSDAFLGYVKSFNYRNDVTSTNCATNQLNNMNYRICIDGSGYSYVVWSRPESSSDYFFTLSGMADITESIGDVSALDTGTTCSTDYVFIQGGTYIDAAGAAASADRFCGLGFPSAGITASNTFELIYITDGDETQDTCNDGFYLKYTKY